MKIFNDEIHLVTQKNICLYNLDASILDIIKESGIRDGFVTINSMHTTTALTINEHESRLLDDVRSFFHRLIPPADRYLHNDIHLRDCPEDEPENAHSHIASMLLGNSENVILKGGQLQLGKWQSVMLVELDGPRTRTVAVQVLGV